MTKLPACMMPDGTVRCEAFRELQEREKTLRETLDLVRAHIKDHPLAHAMTGPNPSLLTVIDKALEKRKRNANV